MASGQKRTRFWLLGAVVSMPALLAGCSSVPDALNPAEWYRDTVDYFNEDDPAAPPATAEASAADASATGTPTEAAAAPASEPVAAPDTTAAPAVPASGLVADTQGRRYAEPIRRQGAAVNALSDEPTVSVAANDEPPAPPASSASPVETASAPQVTINTQGQPASATPQVQVNADAMPSSRPMAGQSIQEVYQASLQQQRPTDFNAQLNLPGYSPVAQQPVANRSVPGFGLNQGGTVIISSSGVIQERDRFNSIAPAPVQTALAQQGTLDFNQGFSAIPSRLVQQGQAQGMNAYNPYGFSSTFQVATIQFGNGSNALTANDRNILRQVVEIHRQQGGIVRVVGHASSRTRDMAPDQHVRVNSQVSVNRADSVGAELLKLGVAGQSLFIDAVADSQKLYHEVMPSGEAGNRRAEIFIDY